MATDHIRYDLLAQDALRDMVRKVLTEVAKTGLKGDHHFNITFATGAPGVRIPDRLREQYPDEMTVVMQYQFWDLKVAADAFEVGLSFGGVPERLTVPFAAITSFVDPSVQFALQFQMVPEVADEPAGAAAAAATDSNIGKPAAKPQRPAKQTPPPTAVPAVSGSNAAPAEAKSGTRATEPTSDKPGAEVVRLDRFRKK